MKSKSKKEVFKNKEEFAENWCFSCKDGGDLRICDHKQCVKSFHPCCVEKDDTFLGSVDHWVCPWHTCFHCHKSSQLHCYTCTNAVCRRCLHDADFSQVKGKFGFCESCLKLALLIEEGKDYDSDGDKVDFTDLETYEGLFMEYYYIIKKEEGFECRDICAARERLKMKSEHQSPSSSEEYHEEDQVSDYDDKVEKCKRMHKGKRSGREMPAIKKPIKSNENEFIGWASRSLIEFLTSIGKNTDGKLSQHDVTSIINEYVKENKLLHQGKRKTIGCDALLQSLFRRKTISRNKVYELLETHFAENHDESSEDELEYDSEDENAETLNASKRQKKLGLENKSAKMELEDNVRQSCFASIIVENIKLVYLKRSLLLELLRQPETFEEKVIGCFVRVKSNPDDCLSRNSYQLRQVEGVTTVSNGEKKKEFALLFSSAPKQISINMLSDGDLLEEECEELRRKILAGQLKRPTVEYLQQKAKILHEDLTKHWINKELALLQRLIDRANEKGWRRELFEYLERRKKLRSPSEQTTLLSNVPTVIPDADEQLNSNSGDVMDNMNSDQSSPQSILRCNSAAPIDGIASGPEQDRKPDHKLEHANIAGGKPAKDGANTLQRDDDDEGNGDS